MKKKIIALLLACAPLFLGAQTFITSKIGVLVSNTNSNSYLSTNLFSLTQSIGFEKSIKKWISISVNISFFREGYRMPETLSVTDNNGKPLSTVVTYKSNYTNFFSVNIPAKIYYTIDNIKLYALVGPSIKYDTKSFYVNTYIGVGVDFYKSKSRFSTFIEIASNDILKTNMFLLAGVKYKLRK